jgi:hypothetical protein
VAAGSKQPAAAAVKKKPAVVASSDGNDGWTDPLKGVLDEKSPLYWANFATSYNAYLELKTK